MSDVEENPPGTVPPLVKAPKRRSAFWLALLLGMALVACKAACVPGMDDASWQQFQWYLSDTGIAAHQDVVYALGLGLIGQLALWACRRRPRTQRVIWGTLVGIGVVSVFYAVLSVKVFEYLRLPLTYPMLYLAGDARNMQSSLTRYASVGYVSVLAGLPLIYLGLVLVLKRWAPPTRWWLRLGQSLGAAVVILWALWGNAQLHGQWGSGHDNRRVADSPHYALVASLVDRLRGGVPVHLSGGMTSNDLQDFLPAAQRPEGARPTPGLKRGPRNVILVVCESVGKQQLGLYGGKFATTPRLEQEAAHSLVFDNFYSHITNTSNSLVALTLSSYPRLSWQVATVERPDAPGQTAAQVLGEKGYRTAFISAGDNEYSNQKNFLANRGFGTLWDYRNSGVEPHFSWGVSDRAMVDMVLKYIDQERDKPFYVMSWTQGTHHPYEPAPGQDPEIEFLSAEDRGQYGIMSWDLGRYLNALHEMDKQLGRLFDELRKRNLADDTIVVITGDHGEAFGWPHRNFGHSYHVYDEDVHVPLMIWSPKLFDGASRAQAVGGHVDISPTILDLLGMAPAPSWQGHSLLDPNRPQRVYCYGALDSYIYGVRQDNWKYICNATTGQEELYDLSADPLEKNDVAKNNPDLAKRLRQRLAAWIEHEKGK